MPETTSVPHSEFQPAPLAPRPLSITSANSVVNAASKRISQSAEALDSLLSTLTIELEKIEDAQQQQRNEYEPIDPYLMVSYAEALDISFKTSTTLKKLNSISDTWKPCTLIFLNPSSSSSSTSTTSTTTSFPDFQKQPTLLHFKSAHPLQNSHPTASLQIQSFSVLFHSRYACWVLRVVGSGVCSDGAVHKKVWTFKVGGGGGGGGGCSGEKGGDEGVLKGWLDSLNSAKSAAAVGTGSKYVKGDHQVVEEEAAVSAVDKVHVLGSLVEEEEEEGEDTEKEEEGHVEEEMTFVAEEPRRGRERTITAPAVAAAAAESNVPELVPTTSTRRWSSLTRSSSLSRGTSITSSPNVSPPQQFLETEAPYQQVQHSRNPLEVIPKRRSSLYVAEYLKRGFTA